MTDTFDYLRDPTEHYIYNGPEEAASRFIFAHGSGAPMDTPFMNTISELLGNAGVRVIRFEFPYMNQRRLDGKKRPPNRADILLDTWKTVIQVQGGGPGVAIGGKSMGGRMASMIADEVEARALFCLGYPFHPPGRPEKTRTEHLGDLKTPTLILQGERDPFGTPDDVAGYTLSGQISIHWLTDGDHGLKPRKASGRTEQQNLTEAAGQIAAFFEKLDP